MGRRMTIAGLVAWVAVMAIGLAALRRASPRLAELSYQITYCVLVLATLLVVVRRFRGGGWIGFAVFGWAYFLPAGVRDETMFEKYPTWPLIVRTVRMIHQPPTVAPPPGYIISPYIESAAIGVASFNTPGRVEIEGTPFMNAVTAYNERALAAQKIGHCLMCVLVGLVGATLGAWLASRRWGDGEQTLTQ